MSAAPATGLKRRDVWFIDLLELGSTWAETSCPRRRSLDTKVCLLKLRRMSERRAHLHEAGCIFGEDRLILIRSRENR
jgi:hypothetical protein